MSSLPTTAPALRTGLLPGLSRAVMRAETAVGGLLVAAILGLMLANAASRSLGRPLVWTDELAVHLMVVLAFLGGSLAVAARAHMTIGLVPDVLRPRARAGLAAATDALVVGFLGVMAVVVWRWLDLPGLIRAGSGAALGAETFNFVWTDPTQTLGIRKIWFWLAIPLSCLTALIHALAALAEDLALWRQS